MNRNKSPRRKRQSGRRHPLAAVALMLIGLVVTGGGYALVSNAATAETDTTSQQTIDEGEKLFAANCATCHGLGAEGTADGPSLIGVGAASVDFQVGTGRMPLAFQGPQGMQKPVQFTDEQIAQMAAYVASLGDGPDVPDEELTEATGDAANGAELFRINCAMCHNVAAAGGALTEGKFAPPLTGVESKHIYEAMLIGPQNMPKFNDMNITPEDKQDIITYLKYIETQTPIGGFELGSLGPVAEGLFVWIFILGTIVAITVWLTARAN